MTTYYPMRATQSGFTLVELLIVAIILAILAAIVVPQFAASTNDARASALRSNVSNIRGAIDLYAQQHGGTFPAAVASTGGTCTGGTAGTGAADTVLKRSGPDLQLAGYRCRWYAGIPVRALCQE